MKAFIEWLEVHNKRTRKVIAVFTAIIWALCVVASYLLNLIGKDTLALLSLVTAQFATVVAFYMTTRAETD